MTSSPVVTEDDIINMVKAKSFLWNIKDPEYKNISLKTEEFENIGRNFNLTGDDVRRKWRSLRSGFRRELLARSNRKPKPKIKQWKHFNKLLFLRESESLRNHLSDHDFDEHQLNPPNNQTICVNQQTNNNVSEDFSDLITINDQLNNQLNSPTSVSMVESCENGDIRLNIISNTNDHKDKNCQEDNNTQIKIIPPNLNTTFAPSQIYYIKNVNGMNDISPFVFVKKPDQTATHQINEEHHHHQPEDQQQQQQIIKQQPIATLTTTTQTTNLTRQPNDLLNPLIKNNAQSKSKKKKDEQEELDANDHFGRMIASMLKEYGPEERKAIRLAVLQLVTDWSTKKGNHHLNNK